jgi:hypothetical protein
MAIDRNGNCWNCGEGLTMLDYGRQDTCRKCGRHTRACRNCEHHEPGAHNDCRENQADRVVEKERFNFCDYFRPRAQAGQGAASRDAMRAAAEALFGKKK